MKVYQKTEVFAIIILLVNIGNYTQKKGGFILYEKFLILITEQGLTPYKVSKKTGISQVTLSDWKSGRSKPKADKLQKIAQLLGVKIEDLI